MRSNETKSTLDIYSILYKKQWEKCVTYAGIWNAVE